MKILIAGDFCPQHRVARSFESGDFATVLGEVKPILESADYSIVNFECAVTSGVEKPIEKIGPNLQCSKRGMEAVKWSGFDCVTLANNHFYDFGNDGVEKTLEACKEYGIDIVGGGMNLQEASRILYKEIAGQTLAIINCCEHEFSIATDNSGGSNPLNPIQQFYDIRKARESADYVLVIVHGGHEMYQLPSPRMQETYRFFVDAGADAVVNHHQHCFSGYEMYNGKPIFYGLGNFCFDNSVYRNAIWNEGYLVMIEFGHSQSFQLIPYMQCGDTVSISFLNEDDVFIKKVHELNSIILSPAKLKDSFNEGIQQRFGLYFRVLKPYPFNRYFAKLDSYGILPSFVSKKKMLRFVNYVFCESHLDGFRQMLKQSDK